MPTSTSGLLGRLETNAGPTSMNIVSGDDSTFAVAGGADVVWAYDPRNFRSGETVDIDVGCWARTGNATYHLVVEQVPTVPASFSGRVTRPPINLSTTASTVAFHIPWAGRYQSHLILSQGAVRLAFGSRPAQTLTASTTVDLGSLSQGVTYARLAAEDGPQAVWQLGINPLPVRISGLRATPQYIRPTKLTRMTYALDADATVAAEFRNSHHTTVRNIASALQVKRGEHSILLDGLSASGRPVPDGHYSLRLSATDHFGGTAVASTQVTVDSHPPVVTFRSLSLPSIASGLVVHIHDQLSGVSAWSAEVDGEHAGLHVTRSGQQLVLSVTGGWRLGRHTLTLSVADGVGNKKTVSRRFTVKGAARSKPAISNKTTGPQSQIEMPVTVVRTTSFAHARPVLASVPTPATGE